ncbi:SRPBCC domain-containing protein [Telmatocola sphagniphila]|uniref:SRPBCC domain-containing protein n=1 Tax=Telmatocola sphagniphila TaxID=1123043 RepID=A0A8E6B664_9BACT|nr:SRPBCC domain-containing protein [Telmatocola sphagniphila]QVL32476.1 SRPBCC domain-containing protein [Telmatocola sphagniphila]
MKELTIRESIHIQAPAAKVWDVLTQPEYTRQYMFGCAAVTDWKVGSPLDWKGTYEGKEMTFVSGKILSMEPGYALVYTTFDPNVNYKDLPENYMRVTYRLTPKDHGVMLEVTQGDFSKVENAEKRYTETASGWPMVLENVKAIAEKG